MLMAMALLLFLASVLLSAAGSSVPNGDIPRPMLPRASEDVNTNATDGMNITAISTDAFSVSMFQFEATDTFISADCRDALNANVSCSAALVVTGSLYTWKALGLDNLTMLCTSTCTSSLSQYRKKVLSACASDVYTDPAINATGYIYGTDTPNDIFNVEGISMNPIVMADYYILNYRSLCQKDGYVNTATIIASDTLD